MVETIFATKLALDLEKTNILLPNQVGYRAGKSAREHAVRFVYYVCEGYQMKNKL